MKKTITFVVACIFAAGASYAASNKSEQPAKESAASSNSTIATDSGAYDYRLERESCCGPQ